MRESIALFRARSSIAGNDATRQRVARAHIYTGLGREGHPCSTQNNRYSLKAFIDTIILIPILLKFGKFSFRCTSLLDVHFNLSKKQNNTVPDV